MSGFDSHPDKGISEVSIVHTSSTFTDCVHYCCSVCSKDVFNTVIHCFHGLESVMDLSDEVSR